MHPRPCVKLAGYRTDDPKSPSEHSKLEALGYDQELSRPVIQPWNETRHLEQ
jgi:hypothetical protein